jgi:hypothetical protein
MLKHNVRQFLPAVPNPWAPYGAQGLDSSVLIWHDNQRQPICRFENAFQTEITVVDGRITPGESACPFVCSDFRPLLVAWGLLSRRNHDGAYYPDLES